MRIVAATTGGAVAMLSAVFFGGSWGEQRDKQVVRAESVCLVIGDVETPAVEQSECEARQSSPPYTCSLYSWGAYVITIPYTEPGLEHVTIREINRGGERTLAAKDLRMRRGRLTVPTTRSNHGTPWSENGETWKWVEDPMGDTVAFVPRKNKLAYFRLPISMEAIGE